MNRFSDSPTSFPHVLQLHGDLSTYDSYREASEEENLYVPTVSQRYRADLVVIWSSYVLGIAGFIAGLRIL